MGILKLIGAVSAAEHERIVKERDGLMRDIIKVRFEKDQMKAANSSLQSEIAALRPDAEKWRDRAARELQRGQAKRDAAKGAAK